jgi:hypothetical protein
LLNPSTLAWAPSGDLLVADRFSHRVLKLDARTGAFLGDFFSAGSGGLNQPTHMAFGYLCDPDCNANTALDAWDIGPGGGSQDLNQNGIPDECDDCLGCDGIVGLDDLARLLSNFGTSGNTYDDGDITGNGVVDLNDLTAFLSLFGTVCP